MEVEERVLVLVEGEEGIGLVVLELNVDVVLPRVVSISPKLSSFSSSTLRKSFLNATQYITGRMSEGRWEEIETIFGL